MKTPGGASHPTHGMCEAQDLSRATHRDGLDGQDCCNSMAPAGPEHRSGSRGIMV